MLNMTNLQIVSLLVYLVGMGVVVKKIDFQHFLDDKKTQHLVLGASVSLFGLWLFRVGITDGLDVHFLWLTAATLLLGLRWALISGFIGLFAITLSQAESWPMFGVNGLISISLPICLTYLIYTFSFHKLPRNFFVYVFVCAFIPGALMIALKMALLSGYYYLDGIYDWDTIQDTYLMLIPLMLFSEAMLNGMTMTLLVIYRPTWVYTFYDKFYFHQK